MTNIQPSKNYFLKFVFYSIINSKEANILRFNLQMRVQQHVLLGHFGSISLRFLS